MKRKKLTSEAKDPKDGNGQNPQNQVDENAKFINNLLYGDNSPSKNLSADENKLSQSIKYLVLIDETISQKQLELNSSGYIGEDGKNRKLSSFEKAKLRNEIRDLKDVKFGLKGQISKLNKKVKASYKMNTQKSIRKSLRISASGFGYQRRNGGAIKTSISNMIKNMKVDDLAALKAELANLDAAKGNTLLMRALLKAPNNLQTKVVANTVAREDYLQYFRNELGVTKKAPKGRRRK